MRDTRVHWTIDATGAYVDVTFRRTMGVLCDTWFTVQEVQEVETAVTCLYCLAITNRSDLQNTWPERMGYRIIRARVVGKASITEGK